MLATRVLTAAALLAAFVAAILWLEPFWFSLVVALIAALAGYEWASLSSANRSMSSMYGIACALLYYSFAQMPWLVSWVCALALLFWLTAVPYWLARGIAPAPAGALPAAGALVLVPAAVAMALLPREQLLIILGLVWVADTAAYFVGSAFGRRKLAPSISPGKTWEGVAGAAIATLIYAIICAMLSPDLGGRVQGVIWVPFLAGAVLLCAVGIIGDLFESALKRQAGAKDSGRLLPGHGGILDRIDSATATLPLALLLMQALGAA